MFLVRCPPVGTVRFGKVSALCEKNWRNPGTVCRVICVNNAVLSGPQDYHHCQESGQWSPAIGDIFCTRKAFTIQSHKSC